ncbi:hypothetical protein [Thioclava sp. F36-6]|uniref:hypothetical protein n=1 Tax=Thioclava sp. F36-6 TaxID=1915316 RepID=UPI0009985781|nr:hypothetical protein [Thioclava sp. F36-6]OOY31098.1 hypothetical protein BMI88_08110 [Thioclava sp. F36-6]
MITFPHQAALMNAYCAALDAPKPTARMNFYPLLARNNGMEASHRREADRLRKALSRLVRGELFDFTDPKAKKLLSELLNHASDRAELQGRQRLQFDGFVDVLSDFRCKHQLSFDECSKWHGGLTSMMLGMLSSRFGSEVPPTDAALAFFRKFIDVLSQPERTSLFVERGKEEHIDVEAIFLGGLPSGTALDERFRATSDPDPERLARLAALTGLTWQLALCEVTLMDATDDKLTRSLAPRATERGGERWSAGEAWVAAVTEFVRLYHKGSKVGSRGPDSEASRINSLIQWGGDRHGSSYRAQRINDIKSGKTPMTFKAIEDICRKIDEAMHAVPKEFQTDAAAGSEYDDWQTHLFKLRLHGHISGFMGYIERVWECSSVEMQRPDFLQDLHAVWQDWPCLYSHALKGHRERLAEFAR